MSKQQSSNTATTSSSNSSLSDVFSAISNKYGQRIQNIDAECDKEIVAIQTKANQRIATVQSEAGREIDRIKKRAQEKMNAIQAEANEDIRKRLAEAIIRVSKEIKKMGKKFQRDASRKCKELTLEEFAAIIAESVRAVRAEREKAGKEIDETPKPMTDEELDKVELGYDPDPDKEMFL